MKTDTTKNKPINYFWLIIFIVFTLIWIYPLIFAFFSSFKSNKEIMTDAVSIIPNEFTLESYMKLFDRFDLIKIMINTSVMAIVVTAIKLLYSLYASYSIVYLNPQNSKSIYYLLVSTKFIPFTVFMIPIYLFVARLGMKDSIAGVIIPQLADATGIFLITQSMRTIPYSFIEVAKLDRVSNYKILSKIVIPLIKPQLTSTGIWLFVGSWNQYLWPSLLIRNKENYTLSLMLQSFASQEQGLDFSVITAAVILTVILPMLLYLVFQKQIIGTFTSSGIK